MERSAAHASQHLAFQASSSGRLCSSLSPRLRLQCRSPRDHTRTAALPDLLNVDLDAITTSLSHMLTLAYEPVVLPCSSLNCGDITYRSTLDPVLRMEQRVLSPQGLALLASSMFYLLAKPGVLQGMVDTYFAAPLQRIGSKAYSKSDFVIGKKIATGGFGTVYKAELIDPTTKAAEPVVLKKATEFGEAEVWMNERMMRASPASAARFITAFSDGDPREGAPLWLAWNYEGEYTLAQLMGDKTFPANLEPVLFDRPLKIAPGPDRRAVVLRLAMQQLLEALNACHSVGIVHRDVKPQNSIVSNADRRVKLIDFGAAADLRVGINYVPNQYLLDPRYAPPEQYIMSSQTPRAPPAPVAAFLSPILWQLNGPDRFDMYSVGVTLMQLACPPLRNDNNLIAFKRSLRDTYKWDLKKWRVSTQARGGREWAEGFATLDALGGGGWDLACQLIRAEPSERLSAAAALAHPWFDPSPLVAVASTVEGIGRAASRVADVDDGWLSKAMARAGSEEGLGFTESQLREELKADFKTTAARKEVPQTSATIAWWKDRQEGVEARIKEREKVAARSGAVQSGKVGAAANGRVRQNGKVGAAKKKKEKEGNGGLIGLLKLRERKSKK